MLSCGLAACSLNQHGSSNHTEDMNWEALAAVGQILGALAVFITLIYLTVQVKHANTQAEIESHRHTWDMLNQFCDLLSSSRETAAVVNKGRGALQELSADERLMFEHVHLRLLNTLESWQLQIDRTAKSRKYKAQQLENLSGIAKGYFGFPGTRELWDSLREYFPTISQTVDSALDSE